MKKVTPKRVRNIVVIVLVLTIALFFFRGCAYRTIVSYKDAGARKNYNVKDKNLAVFIEDNIPSNYSGDIESIVGLSQKITDKALSFSTEAKENDPNKTVLLKRANYAGYAAFTASTGNYLINKYKLSKVWEAKPVKGKLYLFGTDMYSKTKSSIFKDRDFVIFRNKITKHEISVDPTIYDCLKIDLITKD